MSLVQKHKFEAVSLLTTQSGFLDVTIIPVIGQPDWLVPSSLILDKKEFSEKIWNYIWNKQDVAVYHLMPQDHTPNQMLVVEGNTDVHRLALQISGELQEIPLKISEVIDIDLPSDFYEQIKDDSLSSPQRERLGLSFVHQAVMMNGEMYIIPNIDTIAHQLVDLDS